TSPTPLPSFFLLNTPPTTELYPLSLHDALPISSGSLDPKIHPSHFVLCDQFVDRTYGRPSTFYDGPHTVHISTADPYCPELRARSEEHTSELQSLRHLVCRLLLEKKKKKTDTPI